MLLILITIYTYLAQMHQIVQRKKHKGSNHRDTEKLKLSGVHLKFGSWII